MRNVIHSLFSKHAPALFALLLLALGAKSVWADVEDDLDVSIANSTIDAVGSPNETTQRMAPPNAGSGFRWGGYTATAVAGGIVDIRNGFPGQVRFKAAANSHGSYFYTVFDSTGSVPPQTTTTTAVDINGAATTKTLNFRSSDANVGEVLRFLLRRSDTHTWYISDTYAIGNATTTQSVNLVTRQWAPLGGGSNTNLNALANNDEAGLTTGTLDTWANTINTATVDGGGFFVEAGPTVANDWRITADVRWAGSSSIETPVQLSSFEVSALFPNQCEAAAINVAELRPALRGFTFDRLFSPALRLP